MLKKERPDPKTGPSTVREDRWSLQPLRAYSKECVMSKEGFLWISPQI